MREFPIPMEALIHSCVLNRYRCGGTFGETGEIESTAVLSNVRCSVVHSKKSECGGEHIEKSGVVYFDCVNSLPGDVRFLEDGYRSEIVFKGEAYTVTGVRYIYGASGLHHLEILLGN